MDVRDTRCSMASYNNSMSVPIILHTLLQDIAPFGSAAQKDRLKDKVRQMKPYRQGGDRQAKKDKYKDREKKQKNKNR